MAIYGISDLHLALSIDKPMDIFGERWAKYMEKLKISWESTVTQEDFLIIPGDISWATYLEQAYDDFMFIERLPGRKIISKGNHDYWWTTLSKLEQFVKANNFTTISFMHNNSFTLGSTKVCGTRGWKCPGDDDFSTEDRKIYNRELQRLELSLKAIGSGKVGQDEAQEAADIIVALHYPPFNSKGEPSEFVDIMKSYRVNTCVYGHLHGESCKNAITGVTNAVDFKFISSDYLFFKPLKLRD